MFKQIIFAALLALLAVASHADVRDPTMPANLPATTNSMLDSASGDPTLTVNAIRIAGSSRHAIINGITVTPGQQLDGDIRIVKIMPRYVVVNYHDGNKKLYLVPPIKNR